MRTRTCLSLVGLSWVGLWTAGGCSPSAFQQKSELELGEGLGVFEVTAGVPARNMGTQTGGAIDINLGSGSIELDPGAISVTRADTTGGKGSVNFQESSNLTVTVWIASLDDAQTVCDSGEQYGPFDVTLDANLVPTRIDPSNVRLTTTTLDLINGGEFSLCIEVVSPVDGSVTIQSLTFNLGL